MNSELIHELSEKFCVSEEEVKEIITELESVINFISDFWKAIKAFLEQFCESANSAFKSLAKMFSKNVLENKKKSGAQQLRPPVLLSKLKNPKGQWKRRPAFYARSRC